MTQKKSTYSKTEAHPKSLQYRFHGYVLETPDNLPVLNIEIFRREYTVVTAKGKEILRPCHQCKRLLPYDRFYIGKWLCKQCRIQRTKDWQKKNPEAVARHKEKYSKKYRYHQKLKRAGLE